MTLPKYRDEIIEATYDAALAPARWTDVVDLLTRGSGAIGAAIFTPFAARLGLEPIWNTNADQDYVSKYAEYYAADDPLVRALLKRLPSVDFTYSLYDLVDQGRFMETPIYRDLLVPRGVHTTVGLMTGAEDQRAGLMTLFCPDWDAGRIDRAKAFFSGIQGHFRRSMQIHWHLRQAQQQAELARLTLDMFCSGVAWLSAAGEVLYANREMEHILAQRDGVEIKDGRLAVTGTAGSDLFQQPIRMAQSGKDHAILIERQSGNPPHKVLVSPLPQHAAAFRFKNAAAIVFFSETSMPTAAAVQMLQRLYGLTRTETRVAEAIAGGATLEQIAERHGTTLATVRTQLKAIMAKCGVTRQADIIRLVAMLPQAEPGHSR